MKPARFVVGLTGGIGSGKSAALAELRRLGTKTVDLDEIARAQAGSPRVRRALSRAFGPVAADRKALGALVFRSAAARRRLEKITHPPILKEMKARVAKNRGVVVVAVPLLFEKNLEKHFDATVLVACRPSAQVRRVVRRDGLSAAEVRRRIAAQLPLAAKRSRADLVVDNDETKAELRAKTRAVRAGLDLLYGGTPNGNAD